MSPLKGAESANPFPGLRPFREDEEHLFFGRERQIDRMIGKLAPGRFLAIVGTSGSGKSSLVNCGLRPALHRGLMAQAGTSWRVAQFRPGNKPVWALAQALAAPSVLFARESGTESDGLDLDQIVDATLRISALGLVDIYQQAYPRGEMNLLVVADQFEELFRYRRLTGGANSDRYGLNEEAISFVKLLLEACAQRDYPIYVALTMRSDFLGDCTQLEGLPEAINEGQYLVPRMDRAERRSAIEGPIAVGDGTISPVLFTRLVNDVGDNPDQLSILQHALNRTWARCQHDPEARGELRPGHYDDIGSMAHALDRHAEKAWAELATPRQRDICEKVFRALTDTGTDARGIRRPTRLSSLCALTGAGQDEVAEVLKPFRKPSRSFLMPPFSDVVEADTVIDISHESLMRVWDRLKTWAEKEARSARMYRRVSETAALYKAGSAGLIRDRELETLLTWWETEKPNTAWADQYQGEWESVNSLLEESRGARDRDLAEAEFDRRWRHLWRPLVLAAFFAVYVFALIGLERRFHFLEFVAGLFPILPQHALQQVLLLQLSFCVTVLLTGSLAVSWYARRVFRTAALGRILIQVSTRAKENVAEADAGRVDVPVVSEAYAGFWRRFAAHLVDAFIFLGIMFVVLMLFAAFDVGGLRSAPVWSDAGAGSWMALSVTCDWLYHALLTSSRWQASLGKIVMSIVVTDIKGNRVSFARATARYFAEFLSWCTYTIGFIMQPFTKKKQALHDLISRCIVVVRPRASRHTGVPKGILKAGE